MAIGCPHYLRAVRAEHRETIEGFIEGDSLESCPIGVHKEEGEVSTPGSQIIGREDYPLPVGGPRRAEVRAAESGDLSLVGAVGVHYEQFHPRRPYQPLRQQVPVSAQLYRVCRMIRAIHDPLSIGRPPRTPVIPRRVREPADIA